MYSLARIFYAPRGEELTRKKIKPIKKLSEEYTWRTMRDEHARPEHAKREGVIFRWDKPDFDHPGEARGCRCWAECHECEYVAKATNPFEVQIHIGY
ncbi:MAG: minor capsid protein [Nitrospinae bacterium]|nr:minor capsid protein [Nitrospinota bacterium]